MSLKLRVGGQAVDMTYFETGESQGEEGRWWFFRIWTQVSRKGGGVGAGGGYDVF